MQYSFSVIPRVSALIRLWPSSCQLVRGVVPRDKILVQPLAAFSRPDGIAFLFIRTEIIRFSFERDLRAPSSGAPVPVNAGYAAGVGGEQPPSVCFQNGDGGSSQSLRFSRSCFSCRQPQLFVLPLCRFVWRTTVSFPQSHLQRHRCCPSLCLHNRLRSAWKTACRDSLSKADGSDSRSFSGSPL